MSKLKNIMFMAAAMASGGFGAVNSVSGREWKYRNAHREKEAQARAQGLTEFQYGENKLWALNKKNADRKAKKYGWI